MRTSLFLVVLLISLAGCNTSQKENKQDQKTTDSLQTSNSRYTEVAQNTPPETRGYELMTQKCFICHLAKPDPSKKAQMIAPPMVQVQEHYKPTYPDKEEFINAMVSFIQDPSLETTLMPGAVKKFNLMPKLLYEDNELRLIAETLYEHDFGTAPAMARQNPVGELELNNGSKWVLKKETMDRMNAAIEKINSFNSNELSDYNQLGKEIFDDAKVILLDDSYNGKLFDQIHIFFNGIETNMHGLIAAKSIVEAEKQLTELKIRFEDFHTYFKTS
ncbi:hypothetical protein [Salinimicrobium flavum]|uniref:Cytochrome c domain-containing protein n=1 Tax=Salinimicrobium flavum TaxID=1737065 RepID=A0ABW5IVU8_9FLAO